MAKILYFVNGNPTPEQSEQAEKMGALIRDASAYREGDFIERCDYVVGDYPDAYAHLAKPEADEITPDEGPEADGKGKGKGKK